ncbi:MAG: Ig-like domain-containing protein, partial [Planctomycetota bacterium]|nr:Ig-like domain-containing protein [Planctomycetota bacterium]
LVALDTILAVYGQVFPVAPGATIVWDLIVDIALPDESIDHDIAGLNHLNDWYDDNHVYHQGAYGQLNKEIADNLVLPSTKNIYITEYPSPFLVLDENGKEVEVEVLDDVIPGLECSATEAKWLKTNVIDRLNEAVKTASEKYNWTYVGGVGGIEDAFVGHDYGGDGGYYTTSGWWPFTSEDYLAMGGNPLLPHTRGILHPNKDGHEAIADQLFSAVTSKPTIESNNQGSFPATDIHVEFNKDMDDSTFTNASVTVTGSSSGTHTCAFTFDPSTYDLRINPTSDFSYGERVTVKIGAAVTNRFGVALNSPYQYSFDVASRTYIVSAGTGPHGNISPSGPLTLAQGANQTFTAAADSGYVVDTWYLDGQPVKSGGNSYTLANLQGSLSVVVTFRIDTSSGEITLKSPNGGGVYAQGRRMGINWEALRTGGEVKIELLKGGVVSTVIAQSAANSGSYSWQVPNDQSLGSDYRIRVTSLSVLASDASDSDFQIVVKPPPSNDPRDISSLSQLQALQAHWGDLDHPTDGYYRLTNDIDAEATSQWNGGLGFKPIGTGYSDYFRGVFDGQGYRISGLQIKRSGEALVGLFALCMDVGIIKNLFLECRQIEGQGPMPGNDGGVGALVGLNAGTIINCHVTVREGNDLRSYGGKVGGIVGENFRGLIRNCSFTGDIEGRLGGAGGDSNRVGGIAGVNDGTIVWCWTQGTVDGDYSNSKGDHVGGIAGDNFGLIRECYSSSRYIQGQYYVGGIVGYNASGGMIADCYYTGSTVSASIGAGGIVGYQDGGGTVQRCYVTGGIQGGSERGALIGRNWDTVRDCFWDIQTTGYPTTPEATWAVPSSTARARQPRR